MTEIKACPFCGSENTLYTPATNGLQGFGLRVACNDCGADGPGYITRKIMSDSEIESAAAALWNAAADRIDELKAENERLRKEVERHRLSDLGLGQKSISRELDEIARMTADFRKAVDEAIEKEQRND